MKELKQFQVQTYVAGAEWRDDWFCCIPEMHWKRAHFSAVQVLMIIKFSLSLRHVLGGGAVKSGS